MQHENRTYVPQKATDLKRNLLEVEGNQFKQYNSCSLKCGFEGFNQHGIEFTNSIQSQRITLELPLIHFQSPNS